MKEKHFNVVKIFNHKDLLVKSVFPKSKIKNSWEGKLDILTTLKKYNIYRLIN